MYTRSHYYIRRGTVTPFIHIYIPPFGTGSRGVASTSFFAQEVYGLITNM